MQVKYGKALLVEAVVALLQMWPILDAPSHGRSNYCLCFAPHRVINDRSLLQDNTLEISALSLIESHQNKQ